MGLQGAVPFQTPLQPTLRLELSWSWESGECQHCHHSREVVSSPTCKVTCALAGGKGAWDDSLLGPLPVQSAQSCMRDRAEPQGTVTCLGGHLYSDIGDHHE